MHISTVRVAAAQPNYPRAAHMDRQTPQETRLATLAAQTRAATSQEAQIPVMPEPGLGFDPQVEHAQELRALAVQAETYIVIGCGLMTERGFGNETTVLTPSGDFLGIYGKAHPVVFGGEPYGINAGTFPVYNSPLGRLATIICAAPSLDLPGIAELQYT